MSPIHSWGIIRRTLSAAFSPPALLALLLGISLGGCATTTSSSPKSQPASTGRPAQSSRQVDPAQAQRLEKIMVPLIQHMNKPLPLNQVEIGILDSADINAANAGGGKFYVTLGLLEKANDEELEGVLAHEVAHADLGHVAKTQALGAGLNIGTIILDQIIPGSGLIMPYVADLGVLKPFSRKEEYEADAHGVDILNRSGVNGKKIMSDTLTWLLQATGPSGGFFATHPGTAERVQRIRSLPG